MARAPPLDGLRPPRDALEGLLPVLARAPLALAQDLPAWLAPAAATLMAWWLARRLGLRGSGALLAALGYGLSGPALALAVEGPRAGLLGVVLLPALCLALEELRGPYPVRAFLGALACQWGAAWAGRGEEAALFTLVGLAWALALAADDGAAAARAFGAVLAGQLLALRALPAGALDLHRLGRLGEVGGDGLLALGALVVLAAVVLALRADERDPFGRLPRGARPGTVAGLALACGACAWWLDRLGLPREAARALWIGAPAADGDAPARAVALPLPVVGLALAAAFGAAALRRRGALAAGLALAGGALALHVPGVRALGEALPLVGALGARECALAAALGAALVAGGAARKAGPRSATAAGAVLALLLGLALARTGARATPAERAGLDAQDELVALVEPPAAELEDGAGRLRVAVHESLPAQRARLEARLLDEQGAELSRPAVVSLAGAARLTDGRRAFELPFRLGESWPDGTYRLDLVLLDADEDGEEEPLGARRLAVVTLARSAPPSPRGLLVALAVLAVLLLPLGSHRGAAAVGVLVVEALWFALL